MIKACADPIAFERKYPDAGITSLMTGRELLSMILKTSTGSGILVCSAASFLSVPVDRAAAVAFLGQ